MFDSKHVDALRRICARLEIPDQPCIAWVITGSMALALQGVEVDVHDIDLQTDQEGAYRVESRLPEYIVKPVREVISERIRSHFGKLIIDGIQVEIMGDVQRRLDDQHWEEPAQFELHKRWVELEDMRIPVLSLEYEYQAYLWMGRFEKVQLIKKTLTRGNCSGWSKTL